MLELPGGALDTRYGFRHALYRHVFYQRLGVTTRIQLHRRVAAALERSRTAGANIAPTELASQYEAGLVHEAALRCYADAARSALTYFAPKEALDITAHALTLLPRCPEGTEKLELEYAIVSHRGIACSQLFGLASTEAETAYQRALALCDILPRSPVRAQTLAGLASMYYIRGEYDRAITLGERLQALSLELDDPILVVASSVPLGMLHTMRAQFPEGRRILEHGIEAYAALGDKVPPSMFVADPMVVLRANLAIALLHLGYIDAAQTQMDMAVARGEQRGQLMARTIGLWCAAMFAMRMRRPEVVRECAQKLDKLVVDNVLVQAEGPRRWIAGWAEAYLGSPRAGLRLILEGFAFNQRLGMISGAAEVLGYAVEALILASDWSEAQARLDEARQLSGRLGERILFTYQHMLQGRIELGRGDVSAARRAFESGAEEARSQGSIWMQIRLRALICKLPDASDADRAALREVYEQLHDGFDVAVIAEARHLLS
jgi:tetratricopeptide (TPR) repeat protein